MAATASIQHPELRPVRHDERRQAFALLWRAARPDRRQLLLASALLLAAGALEALGPIFGKLFIDEYLLPNRLEGWPVAFLIGGIVISGCVASALRYFHWFGWRGSDALGAPAARERYNHVLRLPMAFSTGRSPAMVSRITNDTEQIRQLNRAGAVRNAAGSDGADRRRPCDGVARLSPDADRDDADSATVVIVIGYHGCRRSGDALAGAAQRHQRADGREYRRHERAAGDRRGEPLCGALCEHQSRALQGAAR